MTSVYRDGNWQSVAEKDHRQPIAGMEQWIPLRWIGDKGENRQGLRVVAPGPQGFTWAVRVLPRGIAFLPGTRVWFRIQRYDSMDSTAYIGPITISTVEPVYYWSGHKNDRKGGEVGNAYGVDIKTTRAVVIDQLMLELVPLREP